MLLIDIDILIVQYICYQEFAIISNTRSLRNTQVGARVICVCPLMYHYTFDTLDEEYQSLSRGSRIGEFSIANWLNGS